MEDINKDIERLSAKRLELFKLLKQKRKESDLKNNIQLYKREDNEPIQLSFSQQRLWFLEQLIPGSLAYNIPVAAKLTGILDIDALESSLNEIIKRHESLRTIFAVENGMPVQIAVPDLKLSIPVFDVSGLSPDIIDKKVHELIIQDNRKPYDLYKGPLLRVNLVKIKHDEHVLIINMHHIISDGWSMKVFMREMCALYEAYGLNRNANLPELPVQFSSYVIWQRQQMLDEKLTHQVQYWKDRLNGSDFIMELPSDYIRPSVQSFNGTRQYLEIDEGMLEYLNRLCNKKGVTLFMVLLAAYILLLGRYSGRDDIVIGVPVAARNHTEIENLIGFFVNMLAIRIDLSDNPTLDGFLARISEATLGAYGNQDIPFERLVEELQPERDLSRNPIFQMSFGFQNEAIPEIKLTGLTLTPLEIDSKTARFDVELQLWKSNNVVNGYFEYCTDLFSSETIGRMIKSYIILLREFIGSSDKRVMNMEIIPEEELKKILFEWNNTDSYFPENKCIHNLFEEQVSRTPDAIALIYNDTQLTYLQLNKRCNQLAHYLRGLGVGPDKFVGICMERSIDMVVAIYGIVKAGGCYVPIDSEYPEGRRTFMIENSGINILITKSDLSCRFSGFYGKILCIDSEWDAISREDGENPRNMLNPENLIYMIYTSGSTGKPKGVMNIHKALVNRLNWMQKVYGLDSTDRVLQKTSFSFDVSVWEFFWPLLNGACLVLAQPGGHKDSRYIKNLIIEKCITTLHFVPSMLQVFLEEKGLDECRCLKRVICSGEVLPYELKEKFFKIFNADLHNLYGPTEAAIDVTSWNCKNKLNKNIVPIGRPIDNSAIYILDCYLQQVPVGVSGELHIGGIGLAKGYYDCPELTAERFISNHFNPSSSARLYKTGDLARFMPDRNIEFLGRIDNQVKIRGLRIELGEIESVLKTFKGIKESAAAIYGDNIYDKRITAYIVPENGIKPEADEIRKYLKKVLPDYMVPSEYIFLEKLPLTLSGKLDRRALPRPDGVRRITDTGYIAPYGELESIIATVWQEVLGIDKAGINDNFFDLGGHSLLMTQVNSKLIKLLNREITMIDMFKYPTISALASFLSDDESDKKNIFRYSEEIKQNIQMQKQYETDIAIIAIALRFPGAVNAEEFWYNLENGIESITFFTDDELLASGVSPEMLKDPNYVKADGILENIEYFDGPFFGYSPSECERIDPQHRVYLECAWEALERAGYNPESYEGRIGVFSGANMSTYLINNVYSNNEAISVMGNFQIRIPYVMGNDKDFLSTRVSYKLNLKGPSMGIQTACSSALSAVHMAYKSLLYNDCDMALAGGVTIKVPQKLGYLYHEGGVPSRDGHCRPFDISSSGTVPGNGSGVIVLKRLSDALEAGDNIYAVIKGSALNNDGAAKVGFTAPSVEGQSRVIIDALTMSGVNAESISYVETHGTGTELGDPIEIEALNQAFNVFTKRKGYCGIGSVKSNIGHLDTAAGIAGIIKTALSLKYKKIPPSINFHEPNLKIDFNNSPFYVNEKLVEWNSENGKQYAGVSSFGIGGTNVHMVLEGPPETDNTSNRERPYKMLMLTAMTESTLDKATANLIEHIKANPHLNLSDIAYTMQTGRKRFKHAKVIICKESYDFDENLNLSDSKNILSGYRKNNERPVIFVFPDQGSQPVKIDMELYRNENVFRNHIDLCCEILKPVTGIDFRFDIFNETLYSQQLLFAIEYSMAMTLIKFGIIPKTTIGYGIGEYTAACVSGTLSLKDALLLVANGNKPAGCAAGFNKEAYGLTDERESVFLQIGRESNSEEFLIHTLAELWLAGLEPDWTEFYKQEKRKRIPLPTYPFERQRYWVEPKKLIKGENSQHISFRKNPDISKWFYIPSWKRSMPPIYDKAGLKKLCWLIFIDKCGFGNKIVNCLEQNDQNYIIIRHGDNYRKITRDSYEINPGKKEDYGILLNDLRLDGNIPDVILHLWNINKDNNKELINSWEETKIYSFYSIIYLMQALLDIRNVRPLQIGVISDNMQRIFGESYLNPGKATLLGLCKVIPQEYENVVFRSIDIILSETESQFESTTINSIIGEFVKNTADTVIAYRGGERWVQFFEPVRLSYARTPRRLRQDGVYIITGGFGGIGLVIAESLARYKGVKLVLIGRTPFIKKEAWDQWLSSHDENDDTSLIIRKIRHMEELAGNDVLILNADVADRNMMREAADIINHTYGQVNGIIHAAGIASGGMIQFKNPEESEKVFRAKIYGTIILNEIFSSNQLDFVVLFSSIDSVRGGFGLADYCAANAFLDAYAQAELHMNGNPAYITSINWDTWTETGMSTKGDIPSYLKNIRQESIKDGILSLEGAEAFCRILDTMQPQVVVSVKSLEYVLENAKAFRSKLDMLEKQVIENSNQISAHERPNLKNRYSPPCNKVQGILVDIWQQCLGIRMVGIDDNFFELDGDSIISLQIAARAMEAGIKITPGLIFEHQTVSELADIILAGAGNERITNEYTSSDFELAALSQDEISEIIEQLD